MNLIQVLDKFPTEINDKIEAVGYDDGEDTFYITAAFQDETNEWQYVRIILFGSGETMLYVHGDAIDNEATPWIWDMVIDFYTEVRNIWKNVV